MPPIIWSVKDIVKILKKRQANEFDGNMAVSGSRGDGKSCLICKMFYRFENFKPKIHQVYSREEVIYLLKNQEVGLCWDDEAINTGYKRDFQNKSQQELIKVLTAYRDNYNIFASAIPSFYSLDKDLRDLYFIHLHVIERGIVVVHMPLQGRLYSQDRWDTKYNAKVEENWSKRIQQDPNFKPPYHKLTTFRGYLYFSDMTPNQKKLYKEIKKQKRQEAFKTDAEKQQDKELSFTQKLYNAVVGKQLTNDGLLQACLVEGKKYSTISSTLNQMLKDNGHKGTLKTFLTNGDKSTIHNKTNEEIKKLVS